MAKNENKGQEVVGVIEATTTTTEETTTATGPKKEGLFKRAKKKATGLLGTKVTFTPGGVLKRIGKGVLLVGGIAGAFALGKKVQEANDNAFLETDFVDGEETVEALPDDVVEEISYEPEEEAYEYEEITVE